MSAADNTQSNWWKAGTVYQIWPASYKDSNGDGLGDIPGIISTLDYLKEDLGIDIIWLSPMYDSPQKDYGYDISNYQGIYPPYGTMQDMDALIAEVHKRGMKLLLDLVINHTSSEHPWFLESKKDRTNAKADWYIWKDPKIDSDGKRLPPNNWRSWFGGSAWEWVEDRQQYYLHLFAVEQPDLNWEPEIVRKAIYKEAIEFWMDRGIDGFRADTCIIYSKNISFPDAEITVPGEEYQMALEYFVHGPRIHEFLQEQRKILDQYGDVFIVGEFGSSSVEKMLEYLAPDKNEFSCVFDFEVVFLGTNRKFGAKRHQNYKHQLPEFKSGVAKVQDLLTKHGIWGTVFLENHDQPRSVSRFATDSPKYREAAARMLALLLSCLSGTLFLYQGQEIGTYNFSADWNIDDLRDIDSFNDYREIKDKYNNNPLWNRKAMKGLAALARDNARLPVQWSAERNAGFTDSQTPWMRVHDDYENVNIAEQLKRDDSPLRFWQKMLKFRKEYSDLTILGDFEMHNLYEQETFTFSKSLRGAVDSDKKELLVMCNFSEGQEPLDIPDRLRARSSEFLISTHGPEVSEHLQPWEGRVYLFP